MLSEQEKRARRQAAARARRAGRPATQQLNQALREALGKASPELQALINKATSVVVEGNKLLGTPTRIDGVRRK